MLAWITANLGTILITFLLLLIVSGIIRSMIKDKKQGKLTCGGNCAQCSRCVSCKSSGTNTVPEK